MARTADNDPIPSRQGLLILAMVAAVGAAASAVGLAGRDEQLPDLLYLGGLCAAVVALVAVIAGAERRRRELCSIAVLAERLSRLTEGLTETQRPTATKLLDEASARLKNVAGSDACEQRAALEAARDRLGAAVDALPHDKTEQAR